MCKFWFGKIKGFRIYGGQILGSPIEMVGHPYNSAAQPVIFARAVFDKYLMRR